MFFISAKNTSVSFLCLKNTCISGFFSKNTSAFSVLGKKNMGISVYLKMRDTQKKTTHKKNIPFWRFHIKSRPMATDPDPKALTLRQSSHKKRSKQSSRLSSLLAKNHSSSSKSIPKFDLVTRYYQTLMKKVHFANLFITCVHLYTKKVICDKSQIQI